MNALMHHRQVITVRGPLTPQRLRSGSKLMATGMRGGLPGAAASSTRRGRARQWLVGQSGYFARTR